MINSVVIMGRLTADPVLRVSETSGKEVCVFGIANQRPRPVKNGDRTADFFNVVCWAQTAKFVADHFSKGDYIVVDGSLRTRYYEGRDGVRHVAFEIWAREVGYGTKRRDEG